MPAILHCCTSASSQMKLYLFIQAVIHEVQRVANTVPLSVFHCTTKDTELMGYSIPKVRGSWLNWFWLDDHQSEEHSFRSFGVFRAQ